LVSITTSNSEGKVKSVGEVEMWKLPFHEGGWRGHSKNVSEVLDDHFYFGSGRLSLWELKFSLAVA